MRVIWNRIRPFRSLEERTEFVRIFEAINARIPNFMQIITGLNPECVRFLVQTVRFVGYMRVSSDFMNYLYHCLLSADI